MQHFISISCLFFLISSVLVQNPALSDEQQSPDGFGDELLLFDDLPTVVYSASKTPQKKHKAPSTIYAFTGANLQSQGILTLRDLLARIPGVQINPNRQGHDVAWFRGVQGRYNSKVLLLVDSVPIRDYYFGNFNLDEIHPIENIERIEVIMGPGSVLYGANAFAGVINITTKKGKQDAEIQVSSYNTRSVATNVSHEWASLFLKYSDTDEGFTPEFGRDGKDRRGRQTGDRDLFMIRGIIEPVEGLTVNVSKKWYEYPALYAKFDRSRVLDREPFTASANYTRGTIEEGKFDFTGFYVEVPFVEKTFKVTKDEELKPKSFDFETFSTKHAGADTYFSKKIQDHTVLVGGSFNYNSATGDSLERDFDFDFEDDGSLVLDKEAPILDSPDTEYYNYAFYLQDIWTVSDDTEITAGVRYDIIDQFDNDLNFRVGVVHDLKDGAYIKGLVGTAFREPSYREFRKVDEGTPIFDPSIQPEKLTTIELALGKDFDNRSNVLITGFYNIYDDFIADVFVEEVDDEVFFNFDKREIKGIEVSGSHWIIKDVLKAQGNITYLHGKDDDLDEKLHALSEWMSSLTLTYHPCDAFSLGLTGHFIGHRRVDSLYQTDIPDERIDPTLNEGQVTLDVVATYRADKDIELQLIGRNITDNRVYTPHFGPSAEWDYELPGAEVLFVSRVRW